MNVKLVPTICPYCGCGCGLNLVEKNGKVVGVEPWKRHPVNEGKLCPKGNYAHEFIHSPDRLTTPLIRKNGKLTPSTWEEAIALIAASFARIISGAGPDSMACLSSAKATNEENYLMQKFARAVLKTANVDHCARLCHGPTVSGLARSFGSGAMTNTIKDIEDSRCIFIIGSNTFEAHPLVARRVLKAKDAGASIIVADPRYNPTARHSDVYAQLRSGSDVALLNAMMYVILAEGLEDREFIRDRTKGFDALKAAVAQCTPEWAEPITGVPAETIRKMARLYASARPAAILYSMGITQHTTGTDNVLSISNLAMLTGNIGKPGSGVNPLRGQNNVQGACDMGALPGMLPGYKPTTDDGWRKKVSFIWGVDDIPSEPGLTLVEITDAIAGGRIKSLYIMGENPVISDPDANHVKRSLGSLDFLVVQDIFLTETAELADVVLPAASFAEKDGTFTNTERRVQLIRRAISPPGQAKPDWEIICMLAKKMGAHGFDFTSPEEIFEEIRKVTPQYAGIGYSRLRCPDGLHWPCPDEMNPGTQILHSSKFSSPDGLGTFSAVTSKPAAETPDDKYPLILTTGRLLYHFHTGSMSRRSPSLDRELSTGFAEINSDDAEELGIQDGCTVRVSSRRGHIELAAKVTPDIKKGIIFIPFHFAECCANKLTNASLDPASKMPELKICAVRLEAVKPGQKTGKEIEAPEPRCVR